ncbi:MAG: TA system VapC family ribonuclease toxin [Deltaproteobacteria bacterium]
MIAVDTNVLVYAHRKEASEHARSRALLERLAGGSERWAIPWPCVYEFFSVSTNPRIWKAAASTPAQAWRQIQAWLASPSLVLLSETDGFSAVLEPLLRARVRGPVVHDARIAALCLAHGVDVLWSRDRDFSLFPELVVENPFETTNG